MFRVTSPTKNKRRWARWSTRLAIPTAAFFSLAAFQSQLHAQLRTGGSERPMYRVSEPTSSRSVSGAPVVTRRAAGVPARTVGVTGRETSILDETVRGQEPPAMPDAKPVPETVAPPAEAIDSGEVIYEDGGMIEDGMLEGSSCGCATCSGGPYSHIAPGACGDSCGLGLFTYRDGCFGVCVGPLARLMSRLSIRAEAPLFWRRAEGVPTLVSSATNGTGPLLGPGLLNEDSQLGMRFTVGTFLDDYQYRGVIARYTNAGKQSDDWNFNSTQNPTLTRPFTNISSGAGIPDTQVIALPNVSTGDVAVHFDSKVDAFDIVMRRLAYRDRFTRVDWLAGYQHNRIEESLSITSNTLVINNPPLNGSSIRVNDTFRTTNEFNGAVLGVMSSRQFAYWQFEAMFRLGLGNMSRKIANTGATTTTSAAGGVTNTAEGLLVRSTNNAPFSDNTFVIAPEVGINAAHNITRNLDFLIGYNYLLLPKVAQAGQQIDTTVNLNDPLTGALRPRTSLVEQRYWLHSLNFGLQWKY